MEIGKTKYCIAKDCNRQATVWRGKLIKSRDYVSAGFCEEHDGMPCPNLFGKKDVYGLYNKELQ